MKSNIKRHIKPCPFCGGEIKITHGLLNLPFLFFKCRKCGAVISFDNDECNTKPDKAKEYFERRANND